MTVAITSRERVLFPAVRFTKGDLVAYYEAVAPVLLPHVVDRPLTVARFPEGVERYGWYQTRCRGPAWMRRRRVGTQDYCVVDDLAGLLALLNAGTIELHPLLSRGERTDIPTAVVFDLDPGPPAGLAECARVAAALAERLRSEGLVPAAKTSGSLGLHVHAAVSAASFAETKELARSLARELAGARPDLVVARQERVARVGKVLVDWGQNAPTRSLPAPYSLRAREAPSVSTPVTWDELESDPAGLAFGPRDVLERVSRLGDVFAPLASS